MTPWHKLRVHTALVGLSLAAMAPVTAAAPPPSLADGSPSIDAATPVVTYDGMTLDLGAVASERRPALAASLRRQVEIVRSLAIRADIAAFFRGVPVRLDPVLHEEGHYDGSGLRLRDDVMPAENPVLLHELLHAWLSRATPAQHQRVVRAYREARANGSFPPDAYMMKNPSEFFAMTASTVLWGRTARPPFTRERVAAALPDYDAWLIDTFGLTVGTPPAG